MQVLPLTLGTYSSSACQTCGCSETSCETCQTVADCSNCASCCCTTAHQSWRHGRIGNGIRIEYLSSGWMAVEVFGSIGVGLIAGSFALFDFGGDSLIELISVMVVLWGLRGDRSRCEEVGIHTERTVQLTFALLFALLHVIGLT